MKRRILVGLSVAALMATLPTLPTPARADVESDLHALMVQANSALEKLGYDIRLEMIEYYTRRDEQGNTVFFSNVGNKQLAFDFVPGDPRRVGWSGPVGPGDDITWATDGSAGDGDAGFGIGIAATQTAVSSAMATWQNVTCSTLPLTAVATGGLDIGFLEFLLGGDSLPVIAADVVHGGWGTAVDALLPPPIIAAAFTFFFSPGTDIDNNGKIDAALREIYYTRNFPWAINGNIDVETVALHEAGHGLSQAHFGKLFRTTANGRFHFAPRAVMNAGYTGVQQSLAGTDRAGHCSNWGSWPNN